MGSDPVYNYPAQPSYGEGMADAMKAQMEQLLGQGEYADIYKKAGFEGGNLGDILAGVEAPIRKQTAQIDTDVLRQTILGGEQKVVKDPETGKYGLPQGVASQPVAESGPAASYIYSAGSVYNQDTGEATNITDWMASEGYINQRGYITAEAKEKFGIPDYADTRMQGDGSFVSGPNNTVVGKEGDAMSAFISDFKNTVQESPEEEGGAEAIKQKFDFYNPNTPADPSKANQPGFDDQGRQLLQEGEIVRTGEGMVDLLGDTRGVQESVQNEDYAQYVKDNPDLQAEFARRRQAGEDITIDEYGQQHYDNYGKAEGRELPMGEYTLQDAGRQAGFDESGQFLGLSALAEDIGRGGQQRAREADIADVERLGGRATEAYRAQGDLGGALEKARAMGAGGSDNLSAIPANPLFSGDATGNLADRARAENLGISAISGGRMGDYDPLALAPAPVEDFRATIEPSAPMVEYQPPRSPTPTISAPRRTDAAQSTSYSFTNPAGQGSAGGGGGGGGSGSSSGAASLALQGPVQPGQPALGTPATQQAQYAQPGGTDAFRSALMQQGMGALDQGITARESRAIQEAARARATNMGRTFDQTASIKEAEDVIREDNARRMQNRAFAQSALGQEVGIQQADLARGLQAQQLEMARQTAGADRQLTAEEKDIERAMRRGAMEEQFRQSGLGAERASAAQMVGLEQATSADPFQAILQRQGQNNLGAGGQLFGSAQYGLQSGPQYLNPEAGLGFISNQATNAANMFGAQSMADATTSGGIMGGLGSLAGGLLGNPNLFKKCWVAREVYGEHNPAWLLFRNWLDTDAPRWFDKLYLAFGERFANFISNKPRLKARIRLWMDSKIGR